MSGALLWMSGPAAPRPRWPLLAGALASAAVADVLLWQAAPGLSAGLAALGTAALILLRAPASGRRAWIVAGLLAASALQSAIAAGWENQLMLAALLVLLLGEAAYPALAGPAARVAAALRALLGAWTRWRPWWRMLRSGSGPGVGAARRAVRLLLPAALLALPFALLLGLGNAVLGQWMTQAAIRLLRWLGGVDLGPGRWLFWAVMATLALALLRRVPPPRHGFALLGREVPPWTRADPRMARWQGILALLVLNMLFLGANAADALHLWSHRALPAGVSFSAFVHQGTDALILATLLSGAVIAAIFQQPAEVTRSAPLRALALGWIAQNLMLLASVVLRLGLYVEAYQLSLLRVWLALFLLVVALGFLLLAWQVLRGIGLRRLVLANAGVVFALFFAMQFVDTAGLVARTNLGMWQRSLASGKPLPLDLGYLMDLGPSAWPAVLRVAEEGRAPAAQAEARRLLAHQARVERAAGAARDWRSLQLRAEADRRALLAAFPP